MLIIVLQAWQIKIDTDYVSFVKRKEDCLERLPSILECDSQEDGPNVNEAKGTNAVCIVLHGD